MPNHNTRFEPDETIQKGLISTTSRLVGEYRHPELAILHAWPSTDIRARSFETPVSRSSFIVAFETPPTKKQAGVIVPDYSPHAALVAAYLSVLFGKRFDAHGLIEGTGHYQVPDVAPYSGLCDPKLPFNSHDERICFPVPLNLEQFRRVDKLLTDAVDAGRQAKLAAACRFYTQALQQAEQNAEVAYLHLITAGEVVSGLFDYPKDQLLARQTQEDLAAIEASLDGGAAIAKRLSAQLLGVKRSFVKSLLSLLDDSFYVPQDTEKNFLYFQPGDMEKRVAAAYDLRSKYVHTGVPFGHWISPERGSQDIQMGALQGFVWNVSESG